MSDTIPDPGEGFTICDIGDPCRSYFWCPNEGQWVDIREVKNSTQWCEEKHGHKCATHWRKPHKTEKTSMSEWVYFSERSPVAEDYPLVACASDNPQAFIFEIRCEWHKDWLAWRSIGPLPKPVDEAGRRADEYVKNMASGLYRNQSRYDFLAGYQAGLKKWKG